MDQRFLKLGLILLIILIIAAFYFTEGDRYLKLEFLQEKLLELRNHYDQRPLSLIVIFCGTYIFLTSLSIPGSIVLCLLAGAIFGTFLGSLLVVTSSAIGATVAFLISRYLLRDLIRSRFHKQYERVNQHLQQEGVMYLLMLRLVPVSPFVVINNVMGVSSMRLLPYVAITWLGMFPGTMIYVFAGREFSQIQKVEEIISFPVLLALTLLAAFPFVARKIVRNFRRKKQWSEV